MLYRTALTLIVAMLVAGCGVVETTPDSTTVTTVVTSDPPATTVGQAGEAADSPCLTGDKPFANEGVISAFGGANGDATQIAAIRWARYAGCEQVVVDLLTADGAPAGSIDLVGVDYRAEAGVVRIKLPGSISQSAIADSRFDGDLIDRAFVVATTTGQLVVDIHAVSGMALSLRAYEDTSPSRVIVDVRTEAEAPQTLGVQSSPALVLLSPQPGLSRTDFTLDGYARGRGGELEVDIIASDGEVVRRLSQDINPTAGLWSEFAIDVTDLPHGELELVVRLEGANDEIRLRLDTRITETPQPPEI